MSIFLLPILFFPFSLSGSLESLIDGLMNSYFDHFIMIHVPEYSGLLQVTHKITDNIVKIKCQRNLKMDFGYNGFELFYYNGTDIL